MKAVVYTRYGPPGVLRLAEVATPVPKDNEVLVKVHAVSVNASDWEVLRGKPLYSRIGGPLSEVPEALRYLGEGTPRARSSSPSTSF